MGDLSSHVRPLGWMLWLALVAEPAPAVERPGRRRIIVAKCVVGGRARAVRLAARMLAECRRVTRPDVAVIAVEADGDTGVPAWFTEPTEVIGR